MRFKSISAIAVLLALSGTLVAQTPAPPRAKGMIRHATQGAIDVSADTIQMQGNGLRYAGNVRVIVHGVTIAADEAFTDQTNGELRLQGNVGIVLR